MAINLPSASNLPQGDLARVKSHEANSDWPTSIEIVAYFGENKRKRKAVVISADQFFGRAGYNAPLTGDQIIAMVDKLRRSS